MDLYLVRHGVAGDADPSQWPDDSQRPLTTDGQKRFATAARGLQTLVPSVDVVLSSPYVRAWMTALVLEKTAGWPTPVACEALAEHAPADVLQVLQPYAGASAVALVGHEPSLHQLASYLLTSDGRQLSLELKKGGVMRVILDERLRPGSGRLVWLLSPRIMRQLAQ